MDRREVVSGMVASTALLAVAPTLAIAAQPPAPVKLSTPPTFQEAAAFIWEKCQSVADTFYSGNMDAARAGLAAACTRVGDQNQPRWPFVESPLQCYDSIHAVMGELYISGMPQNEISKALCHVRDTRLKVAVSLLPRAPLTDWGREMVKMGFQRA